MWRLVQCVLAATLVCLSQATVEYDLSLYCGTSISVYSSARLKVNSYSSLRQSCVVSVNSAFHFWSSDRIRLEIRSLNMPCWQSAYINLYDGSSTSGSTLAYHLCNTVSYQTMYVTASNNLMTIDIEKGASSYVTMDLLATATSYTGQSGDFYCDNGYRVDSYLQCDGDNNCGDWSDENSCSGFTFHVKVGVIAGCTAFGAIVFIIVLVVVIRRRRRLQTVQYQGFGNGGQNYGTVTVTQSSAQGSAYMPAPPSYSGSYGAAPPPAYKAPPAGAVS